MPHFCTRSSVCWREPDPVLHLLQPLHLELELVRVLLVVVEHGEGLAAVDAVRAAERLLPRVQPDVVLERLPRLEPLATLLALELGLQMDPGMLGQHRLAAKRLVADITGVHVGEVDAVLVAGHGGLVGEDLAAVLALDLHGDLEELLCKSKRKEKSHLI